MRFYENRNFKFNLKRKIDRNVEETIFHQIIALK